MKPALHGAAAADAFQLPEIRLLGVASKSVTKNYIIYYHGELDHAGKTYEARIELGYYG